MACKAYRLVMSPSCFAFDAKNMNIGPKVKVRPRAIKSRVLLIMGATLQLSSDFIRELSERAQFSTLSDLNFFGRFITMKMATKES
jgi:hypothetical protein